MFEIDRHPMMDISNFKGVTLKRRGLKLLVDETLTELFVEVKTHTSPNSPEVSPRHILEKGLKLYP